MGFSSSSSSETPEEQAKKKADMRRFENDLISMQADRTKFQRGVDAMELDLRTMQKNYTALGFAIKDKLEEVKKSKSSLQFLDEEIRVLKKRINTL